MGNIVEVLKNDHTEEFTDILGHQIGNGAIQILFMNGNSRIIFNPDDVTITLDDESSDKFEKDMEMKMQMAVAQAQPKAEVPVDAEVLEEVEVPREH